MRQYLPILGVVLVWSSAYPLIKIALQYMSPIILAIIRLLVGGLILLIYGKGIIYGLKEFIGSLLNVAIFMILLNLGVLLSPNPALSATLIYTQPVFVAIFSYFIFKEKIGILKIFGIIIAISGAIIASGNLEVNIGALISLLGGITWAVGTIYYRKYLINEDVIRLNSFFALSSVPVLVPLIPFQFYFKVSLEGIVVAIIIGITAQALGFIFWFSSVKSLGAFKASSISLLVPALSYFFSYIILGDMPTLIEMIGSFLVLFGVLLTNLKISNFSSRF
ncbi:DMT family transporter [Sulfurisphaera ohwakuensis]|uniref:Drug/metabolite transporter (DMT)-like permease n=1 Tax=Sulfurisphaera ohwakuensis TaxID=69656 RepID=A0A650CK12_SULOH|nr:DMT family transporter [Sulfurisphaera ohwakuensis]MBB5253501.1 drug/metabolite transporter (DMT)-like permease [Sulfurisphaera ohwakuensis]QGR17807.1 EamA family transporter [Sulfurisphaera ohwakuensis]